MVPQAWMCLRAQGTGDTMNWFCERRQEWIAETVRVFGFINREHITRKFGVSIPQASLDLREFQRQNPRAVIYDKSVKQYVAKREG
jgi:hypothetical protein